MHSKGMRSSFLAFRLFFVLLIGALSPPSVFGQPCFPSDPEGLNPGNLCPGYPTHGMTINSNSFQQGFASEAYYGRPLGPFQPGALVQQGHLPRTPIDPRPRANGFWTKIDASNGETRMTTNTGREFIMRVEQ
jgi:hypothetical protein